MIDLKNISETNWRQTRITILGAARSGLAAAELALRSGSTVLVSDSSDSHDLKLNLDLWQESIGRNTAASFRLTVETGGHTDACRKADLIVKSPGIPGDAPVIQNLQQYGIPIVGELEFAFWFSRALVVAVTGSNGKTTSVHLLRDIVANAGYNPLLGGNTGTPFSANVIEEMEYPLKNRIHVLEVSSFQLDDIVHFSPSVACILNVSPDHLDRYSDYDSYIDSKLKIADNLPETGWLVYDDGNTDLRSRLQNDLRAVSYTSSVYARPCFKIDADGLSSNVDDFSMTWKEIPLKGEHNQKNIIAMMTVAHVMGISTAQMLEPIRNFKSIPHRLELVKVHHGVRYYNDSKATNIASALAGITSFQDRLLVILGGQDKGNSDFTELLPALINRADHVFAYGQAGHSIKNQLNDRIPVTLITDFRECVRLVCRQADPGQIVLLSPGCASFDQFSNFEQRGDEFRAIVQIQSSADE